MRFVLMLEPQQGLSYAEQLEIARRAEELGFEALFRSDHYQSFPGPAGLPTTDAWAVLAGLARETRQIGLGVLVSPVTFRLPGNLAKVVMTVQEMSGGRIELGLGAGWNEEEHRQHAFPFPPIETRAEMLEEQIEIILGLWERPDGWSFRGRHYTLDGSRFAPKPQAGRRPRLIVGGEGTPRSLRIAARHADEFNVTGATPDRAAEIYAQLDVESRKIARDPGTIARSAMVGTLIARDEAALGRRAEHLLRRIGRTPSDEDPKAWLAVRRPRWVMGTYDEARATVGRYAAAGVERLVLQDMLPWDLDMIEELGTELVGRA
ncbi:MAG TPA: TIGR03560 family F420-dependent LLM class oxidoreductase [Candidatus Saccharimonadales bacterium]|nr:TIGR03560 family F420-dependent LLM class oxidoreductase [Candidatus Saccharimonadales bacterium]